ncbi:hypothetical protein [Riemerella columbina]|uniref:hypothetical protein n=1 Tax=Riemerella columbina TaxID=103810 RepID=UPI0003736F7B|nr:hypothetical protein [Riemerella columbina]
MKIKNLLRILFSAIGLYIVVQLAIGTFQTIIKLIFSSDNSFLISAGYLLVSILFLYGAFYLLVSNPDIIINKIKPKKFLDENINIEKLNMESLLQIAILSIGILMLFEAIPETINYIYQLLELKSLMRSTLDDYNTLGLTSEFYTSLIKVLVGSIYHISTPHW